MNLLRILQVICSFWKKKVFCFRVKSVLREIRFTGKFNIPYNPFEKF